MMGLDNVRDYSVQVWVMNNAGEILLFRKADAEAECWSIINGITGKSESCAETAIRLVREKTGIILGADALCRMNMEGCVLFICRKEIVLNELKLSEEDCEAIFAAEEEFKKMSDEGKLAQAIHIFWAVYHENAELGILDRQNCIFIDETKPVLKGNIHTHSNRTDGMYCVEEVAGFYRKAGYDFLAMSDHDLYYDGDVDDKIGDLLLIHGIEATCTYNGNDPAMGDYVHCTCLERKNRNNTEYHIGYYKNAEELQSYIEYLNKDYQLVQFNHPLFPKLLDSDFVKLSGYQLFEIYNHKDHRWETGTDNAEWLARVLLNHGVKLLVTAGDDFHGPYKENVKFGESFGGFIMVQAEKNTDAILDALRQSKFYASTGPLIYYYSHIGQCIKIKTSDAKRIIFYSNMRRCQNVFREDNSMFNEAEYVLTGEEKYIWTKVVDAEGNAAWTQPIFL